MKINLEKFGTMLISRQLGKEAFAALQPQLQVLGEDEDLELDFMGVITFAPSWGDEFLSPLHKTYGTRLVLKDINNPSVRTTIELLEEIYPNFPFRISH